MPSPHASGRDLLHSQVPGDWERMLEALGLPALIVAIEARMGSRLRTRLQAEDVLQEALLHAWKDRARLEWRGIQAFRRCLLRIAENRMRDIAAAAATRKRGDGREPLSLDTAAGSEAVPAEILAATTTPGRVAAWREQADILGVALRSLPNELEPVVRLRLIEERSSHEVAQLLGIGLSAVKHRLRRGATLLKDRLASEQAARRPRGEGRSPEPG